MFGTGRDYGNTRGDRRTCATWKRTFCYRPKNSHAEGRRSILKAAVAIETLIRQRLVMIHVLFSPASGTLRKLLMGRDRTDRIAHFTDTLDWGPIQTGDFADREAWFDRFAPMDFGKSDWLGESALKFRQNILADPERLIWISPRCQQDLSGLHWFLAEFGGAGSQMIVADYPLHGTWRDEPPLQLSELQEDQIAQLLDGCPRREWNPSHYPKGRWRILMAEAAYLRIVEGGILRSVEADYFDHFLLKRCSADWVKAHRVAADAMGDIWDTGHSPDGAFLFWRLRELILSGAVVSDGELPLFGGNPRSAPRIRR